MNAKMKGLFKGLRYISSIFDPEEKEEEIVIGFPTDVKHVSHIGCDGPNVDSGPSWMKEFKSTEEVAQSTSLNVGDIPEIILTSEGDLQRKTCRRSKELTENTSGLIIKKDKSRRRTPKDSPENSNSIRHFQQTSAESPTRSSLDISKNSRRRNTKDPSSSENSNSSRQDGTIYSPARTSTSKKSKEFGSNDSGLVRSSRSKGKRPGVESNVKSVMTNER